ncbi:MAG: hypothetical protein ABSF62_08485 [Bryobacteraceae bacterium]|jgi:hypothetical protein
MTDIDVDVEAAGESLEKRLARGAMTFREALEIATEMAAQLRDLHAHGLEYGALSAQTVVIGRWGAGLAPRGGLARRADGRGDVAAFGELLELMLDGAETPQYLLDLWADAAGLAQQCLAQAPEIQQVLIPLRLLGMRARMAVPTPPVNQTPAAGLGARLRSLALLAADALRGSSPAS